MPPPPVVHCSKVKMRLQFFAEGKPVDLNCGRYCAEAAILWTIQKYGWPMPSDVFHEFLPKPANSPGGVAYLGFGWSPAKEGKDLTEGIPAPTDITGWRSELNYWGPIIVSVTIGHVVGHFILVIGADAGTIQYKDPLKGNKKISMNFADFDKMTNETVVYGIRRGTLEKKLKEGGYSIGRNAIVDLP